MEVAATQGQVCATRRGEASARARARAEGGLGPSTRWEHAMGNTCGGARTVCRSRERLRAADSENHCWTPPTRRGGGSWPGGGSRDFAAALAAHPHHFHCSRHDAPWRRGTRAESRRCALAHFEQRRGDCQLARAAVWRPRSCAGEKSPQECDRCVPSDGGQDSRV